MLLWFDHVDEQENEAPMGATVETITAGTFRVHAVGSFRDVRAWSSPIYLNYRASEENGLPPGDE